MRIPFLDLTRQHREIEAEAAAALTRVMAGGVFILGREVEAFEEEWARFCGVRGAAGVNSGTDALALALIASGAVRQGRQDEVITSPLTAAYTALAILNAGGVPVFADIDPQTYTLDPSAVERVITPRTRAIMPVHLYGQMADMPALCEVAARHGLTVIEDAAQAHGARIEGKRAGALAHAAAFSFYPTKNLGACGDGGAVTSDDLALIQRVKTLRQGGHAPAFRAGVEGRNSRLDEMQAVLLRVKLQRLEKWNERRRSLTRIYDETLRGTRLQLPSTRAPEAHVYHLYVTQHPQRDRLRSHLAAHGIEALIYYPFLLHQQPLFRRPKQGALPVAEDVAGKILSLPLHPHLTEEETREVADKILLFES
ncbi:MAG TPA: DegT/DnrJ/EryC1/StrS family aminotransferase [Pyrinomonadaceae bacterium]|nr:DegT/DnrJ/EryC1/StrS family aminotransferase [Pyrinomonadaceae bacterium]